ncbi:hypothetical protein CEXT_695251 [Caerostris extrusa]|uniref:Uncharacterized protein n=1 Tax=Caerostris extrusa TaxID=172846 RepID=A0AAV4URL0_CAEEX|nr:hypothetical protein CEXT_695251 [Caerostris extrusa]
MFVRAAPVHGARAWGCDRFWAGVAAQHHSSADGWLRPVRHKVSESYFLGTVVDQFDNKAKPPTLYQRHYQFDNKAKRPPIKAKPPTTIKSKNHCYSKLSIKAKPPTIKKQTTYYYQSKTTCYYQSKNHLLLSKQKLLSKQTTYYYQSKTTYYYQSKNHLYYQAHYYQSPPTTIKAKPPTTI